MVIKLLLIGVGTFLVMVGIGTVISIVRTYKKIKADMQFARVRTEWASLCVTYDVIPYHDDTSLRKGLYLLSARTFREETDGGHRKMVSDQVKAVTVVHNKWPLGRKNDEQV